MDGSPEAGGTSGHTAHAKACAPFFQEHLQGCQWSLMLLCCIDPTAFYLEPPYQIIHWCSRKMPRPYKNQVKIKYTCFRTWHDCTRSGSHSCQYNFKPLPCRGGDDHAASSVTDPVQNAQGRNCMSCCNANGHAPPVLWSWARSMAA